MLVFGLALVEKEDTSNWKLFLNHMKAAIDVEGHEWKPTFVSDRQKGLIASKRPKLTPEEQNLVFQMAKSECENDYKFYSLKLADTRLLAAE
ncbi:uncharacterized protein IUM83_06421 [Phytophthora cinnamomi]|uniref:uncharacterized protein n=1 Tax=Phytophthora cinnamomi TaxID=4785 RepID=UPI00355A490A|nr:hypothetical protein IUM83_06421 [Phytophthora cinnamomi]